MLSRLDNLADDSSGTTKYAQYGYFGAGSIYKVEHPAVSGGRSIGGTAKNPAWDNTGNLSDDGESFTYKYDFRNRLVEVARKGGNKLAAYSYDGLNRRIRKVVCICPALTRTTCRACVSAMAGAGGGLVEARIRRRGGWDRAARRASRVRRTATSRCCTSARSCGATSASSLARNWLVRRTL